MSKKKTMLMKIILTIVMICVCLSTFSQNLTKFDSIKSFFGQERYIFEKYHEYKNNDGLVQGMLDEITKYKDDLTQQSAVIAFYDQAYGYKWVNHSELTHLIDSIISNPTSASIKKLAISIKHDRETGLIGKKLPEIKLADAQGKLIDVNSIKAKYIIIDLWATWCSPCLTDMKKIPKLKDRYTDIEFYSISFDKDYKKMAKFVSKEKYDWPIVFAGENHELWKYFRVRALPRYFIVNEEKEILYSLTNGLEEKLKTL